MVFYGEATEGSTSWYCTDLIGGRYPSSGYLVANRKVKNPSNLQHISISYTGSDEGDITTVADNVIARAEPINGTVISKVEFSLDGVNWYQAFKENGETSYKVTLGSLSEGEHTLRVRIDDITQHGLIKTISVVPEPLILNPKVVRFGWDAEPGEVRPETTVQVGQQTSFFWEFDNVAGCLSTQSGEQDLKGSKGPFSYYGIGTTSTTQWYCIDLEGNRFPDTGYFEATKVVENNESIKHVAVNYKSNDGSTILKDTEGFTATISQLIGAPVSEASFRVIAMGTTTIISEVIASKDANSSSFSAHFTELLSYGNYVLQVAINGVYQGGLDTYFTVHPNIPLTITGTPTLYVQAGNSYSFIPEITTSDPNKLTFTIEGKPAWATFNSQTGALTGTPTQSDIGIDSGIVISVSDTVDTLSLPAFDIEVITSLIDFNASILSPIDGSQITLEDAIVKASSNESTYVKAMQFSLDSTTWVDSTSTTSPWEYHIGAPESELALSIGANTVYVRALSVTDEYSSIDSINVDVVLGMPRVVIDYTSLTASYVVSWPAITGASSYQIETRIGQGEWQALPSTAETSVAYESQPSGLYSYRVKACTSDGECSDFSVVQTVNVGGGLGQCQAPQ